MVSKKKMTTVVLALAMVMMLSAFSTIASAEYQEFEEDDEQYETELTSVWTDTPPIIDGSLEDEWAWDMNQTYSNYWFVPESDHVQGLIWTFFANDGRYLYVAVDLTPDNSSEDEDYCFIGIDLNGDHSWDELNDTALYIYGDGEAYALKGIYGACGYEETDQADWKHRVWEFAIDMNALELTADDPIELFMFGYGTLAPEWWYPAENTDGGSYPDDIITAEISLSVEPIIPEPEEEPVPSNVLYAMYFAMFAMLSTIILMVGFERIWNWASDLYSKGEYWKTVLTVYGLPLLFSALATLQYYWDWVGKFFGL